MIPNDPLARMMREGRSDPLRVTWTQRLIALVLGLTVIWTVQLCTPLGKYMGPDRVSTEQSCDQVGDGGRGGPGTDPKESLDHTEGFAP